MILKTNLHFHTGDDPLDNIEYSTIEGINRSVNLGFDVLAITCHEKVIFNKKYKKHADSKGILLISGIEINIGEYKKEKRHLLILNCDQKAEKIKTFNDLENYKKTKSDIFVIAPHPFFPSLPNKQSLMEYTNKYSHLFDAIEHSWFYSKMVNRNIPAKNLAEKNNLPLIATSDTHFFSFLNTDYCMIETKEKTTKAIFESLKEKRFKNKTKPKKIFKEIIPIYGSFCLKNIYKKLT